MTHCNYRQYACKILNKSKGEETMIGVLVIIVLAVLIFIGLKNKKKIAAEQQKAAEEKEIAEQKAAATFAPFKNKAAKQYYEMAYGLLSSSSKERSADDVRRFVEFHTSRVEVFDMRNPIGSSDIERKFLKEGIMTRLSLFKSNEELTNELFAKGISADEIEQIIKLNKELDESLAYRYSAEDADTICDPKNYAYGYDNRTVVCKISKESIVPLNAEKSSVEKAVALKAAAKKAEEEKKIPILQEIEKDCKEVFDNCSSYELGNLIEELQKCLDRKKSVYVNNLLRNTREADFVDELEVEFKAIEAKFEAEQEAELLFCEVLYDNYFDKLRRVLVDTFNKILSEKRDLRCKLYGADKYMMIAAKQAAAITLRALNYENHGQSKEKYSAITENTCREFISNYEMFKSEDENKVANDVLGEISGDLCGGGVWYLDYELKDHHIDAVCHAFWKSVVAKLQESDSADSNYIFNMFFDYFKPNQDKLDHLAVEHRQYMELEARKKAVSRQCDGCARCDYCQEKYKRENCSAWIPRS